MDRFGKEKNQTVKKERGAKHTSYTNICMDTNRQTDIQSKKEKQRGVYTIHISKYRQTDRHARE